MKSFLHKIKALLPRPLRNKYLLTGSLFIVWILLFDPVNLVDWLQERNKWRHLQREEQQLKRDIEQTTRDIAAFSDADSLEKIAREKFYFTGPDEEIFLIEE
jgi:cell division protein FtsB